MGAGAVEVPSLTLRARKDIDSNSRRLQSRHEAFLPQPVAHGRAELTKDLIQYEEVSKGDSFGERSKAPPITTTRST